MLISSSFSRLASLLLSLGPPAISTVPGATGGPGVEFMARPKHGRSKMFQDSKSFLSRAWHTM